MFIRTRTRTRRGYGIWRDVRESTGKGEVTTYYQAVEAYRDEDGRPRHRVLAAWNDWSDGATVADAIASCARVIANVRGAARHWRGQLAELDRINADREKIGFGPTEYHPFASRHRNVMERDAAKAERRLAREEARLLALRQVGSL